MANRGNCDLHIPFKALRAESTDDIAKLARDISEDMKVIERWAHYFHKNCVGGAACEAAIASATFLMVPDNDNTRVEFEFPMQECGMRLEDGDIYTDTPGLYHITGHAQFFGFEGLEGFCEMSISTANGGIPGAFGKAFFHDEFARCQLQTSADDYIPDGSSISMNVYHQLGVESECSVTIYAHLVHCDCVYNGGGA